ncbi:hypothetical protein ACSHT2_02365 [Bradyrhizobium sp. PUT101]|uniref:hypothetical protein n=1 Tax=Bradyrhizobium sp. PUT101 TaxID=3447427 RepID=UPI003F828A29
METSLTMVLAEPPPDPELPPADCEDDSDEVDEAASVDEAADVEDAVDVGDAADDDAVAVDADVVRAAVVDAIAPIDMETSLEGDLGHSASCAPDPPFNAHTPQTRRGAAKNSARQTFYGLGRSNQTQHRALQVFPSDREASVNVNDQRAPAMDGQSSRLTSV